MVLARAWRRRLYASFGMTLIVPVALLISLTALALSGGVPGLGSLGEAFSGPSAPPVAAPVLGGQAAGSRTGRLLRLRTGTVDPAAGFQAAHVTGSGPVIGAPDGLRGTAGPGGSGGLGGSGGGGGSARGGGGGYSGSPPSGGPPSRNPTVVNRILGTLTPVTASVPGPVGSVLTGGLRSGGRAADRVLRQLPGQ